MLDLKTASTIATSIVHAKLDYCNSLFLNIDVTKINRLQAIQNALARAVTKTPKHHHITPVLKKLHWLKIPERIEYNVTIQLLNGWFPNLTRAYDGVRQTTTGRQRSADINPTPDRASYILDLAI